MNVLMVHRETENLEAQRFELAERLKADVHWVTRSVDAIDHLLQENPVDLLICENGEDSMVILKYLISISSDIPHILIGQKEDNLQAFPDLKNVGAVESVKNFEEIEKFIQVAIAEGKLKPGAIDNDYCRIATELLIQVVPLKADIYIRLSKIKFVKMFRRGQVFKREDAERYLQKKSINFLYVRKDEAANIIDHFKEAIAELVESDRLPAKEQGRMAGAILDSVVDLANTLGFTEEVQEVAKRGVDLAMKSIGTSPKLSKMLEFVKGNKGTYFSNHSMALAHVACAIAAKLDWPSESTYSKLTMAAYFHDIVLKRPELAEIETLQDVEDQKNTLSDEDLDFIKNHPMAAAEILRKFREMPPDVDVIVAQHHERSDGTGFPRKLTSFHIAPLAALFIVAHDLVQFLYEEPDDISFDAFVRRFGYSEQYTKGTFAKAINAIEFKDLTEG